MPLAGAEEIANSDIRILEEHALEWLCLLGFRIDKSPAEKTRRRGDAQAQCRSGEVAHAIVQLEADFVRPRLAQAAAADAELSQPVVPIENARPRRRLVVRRAN